MHPSTEPQRFQITTAIKGLDHHLDKRLKRFIQEFLWKRAIGCNIERIPHSTDPLDVSTVIIFLGDVQAAKLELIKALENTFPQISIPGDDEWIVEESKEKLSAARIAQTNASIRRGNSSGEVSKSMPLDRMDAFSSSASSWVQNMYEKALEVLSISQALQATGKLQAKLINLYYMKRAKKMEVSLLLWNTFLEECRSRFGITGNIRRICQMRPDGLYVDIEGMEQFENGQKIGRAHV